MKVIHNRKFLYSNGWGYVCCSDEYHNIATLLEFSEIDDSLRQSMSSYLHKLERDGHVGERIVYAQQDWQYASLIAEILGNSINDDYRRLKNN